MTICLNLGFSWQESTVWATQIVDSCQNVAVFDGLEHFRGLRTGPNRQFQPREAGIETNRRILPRPRSRCPIVANSGNWRRCALRACVFGLADDGVSLRRPPSREAPQVAEAPGALRAAAAAQTQFRPRKRPFRPLRPQPPAPRPPGTIESGQTVVFCHGPFCVRTGSGAGDRQACGAKLSRSLWSLRGRRAIRACARRVC